MVSFRNTACAWKFNISSMFFAECQVIDGAYDGTKLSSTSQAVLSENSLDKSEGYSIPLEIKPSGQFEPLYRTTLSVQVFSCSHYRLKIYVRKLFHFLLSYIISSTWKDGELPVLPLSVYGAVAMAHNEDSEEYSSPCQFFFYLYDKRNVSLILYFVYKYIFKQFLIEIDHKSDFW